MVRLYVGHPNPSHSAAFHLNHRVSVSENVSKSSEISSAGSSGDACVRFPFMDMSSPVSSLHAKRLMHSKNAASSRRICFIALILECFYCKFIFCPFPQDESLLHLVSATPVGIDIFQIELRCCRISAIECIVSFPDPFPRT